MTDLTDNERAVLKQLHDGVIRPLWPLAQRSGLDIKDVEDAAESLKSKGLVEQRKGTKWKITFDGKVSLGIAPSDIDEAVDRLTEAAQDDVQEISGSQIKLLNAYYKLALDQATRSFHWALVASIVGLLFFLAAVVFVLTDKSLEASTISVVGGAIIEIIAGINFYLYGKTIGQLSAFHGRLEATARFLLANSLCEGLTEEKEKTRAALIRQFVETGMQNSDESEAG